MRPYLYLLLTGLTFLWGCGSQQEPKNEKSGSSPSQKDNYIVLLDVSNRILYNNQQQIPKDISVIQSIYGIFKAKLAAKDTSHQYYLLNDKLKLLAAPNWYYASIDLSAEQPDKKAALTSQTEKTLNTLLPGIYKQAVISNSTNDDAGADIWKYFNDYLTDDLDKDAQNTLFIITDGYMNVKKPEERPVEKNRYAFPAQIISALKYYPDWETRFTQGDYGLLPVKKKFPNLRVILLQINPREGWENEYSLLTKIWGKWFTEMGISNYHFIKNDTITAVDSSLARLMNIRIDTAALAQTSIAAATDSTLKTIPANITEKKTIDTVQKAPVVAPPPAQAAVKIPGNKNVVTVPEKKPVVIPPPVVAKEKPNTAAVSSPEVTAHKKRKTTARRSSAAKNDDILSDNGAANGFNTGIKKGAKKKNQ